MKSWLAKERITKERITKRQAAGALLPAFLSVALFLISSTPAFAAGTWQEDRFGCSYLREDGTRPVSCWEQIDGDWYYFKDSGYMATGPLELNGVQYYMEESGAMVCGEWLEFRGGQYYFMDDGSMAKSAWVDDIHYVNEEGRMAVNTWVDGVRIDEDGIAEHPGDSYLD